MKVVVADTSPINYLVLIDCIDILRRLYARVVIPEEVLTELTAAGAPTQVSEWIRTRPSWIEVRPAATNVRLPVQVGEDQLDAGEIAAIAVALGEDDSLLLIDESAGRIVASRLGVANTGTLGVLLAAARGEWWTSARLSISCVRRISGSARRSSTSSWRSSAPRARPNGRLPR